MNRHLQILARKERQPKDEGFSAKEYADKHDVAESTAKSRLREYVRRGILACGRGTKRDAVGRTITTTVYRVVQSSGREEK